MFFNSNTAREHGYSDVGLARVDCWSWRYPTWARLFVARLRLTGVSHTVPAAVTSRRARPRPRLSTTAAGDRAHSPVGPVWPDRVHYTHQHSTAAPLSCDHIAQTQLNWTGLAGPGVQRRWVQSVRCERAL